MIEAGKGVTREDLLELKELLEHYALLRGDFVLSSGTRSKYYFDGKGVTLEPDVKRLIALVLDPIVRESRAEAVGGLEIGAVPIACALPFPSFIVRDEKKGHGTRERIAAAYSIRGAEGELRSGLRVAIVDDVVTTGDSIVRAIEAVQACDCEVVAVVALVTRPERGAAVELRSRYNYISLFESDEEGNLSLTAEAEALTRSPVV